MSVTMLQCKEVNQRKEHRCEWCAEMITEKAVYRAYVMDGDFVTGYQHIECFDAMVQTDIDDDGFSEGFFQRGSSEPK